MSPTTITVKQCRATMGMTNCCTGLMAAINGQLTLTKTITLTLTLRALTPLTQLFYGSLDYVLDNPVEPVREETFTTQTYRGHQSSLICFIHLL